MGNTYLEPRTKTNLLEYMEAHKHKSPSRAVDALLAEHDLLLVTQRECELLRRLLDEANEIMLDGVMPTRRKQT